MKSPHRLISIHSPGSAEYKREWDKLLPDGKTCSDCVLKLHCVSMFQDQNTYCQFSPNKFKEGEALPIKVKKSRSNGKVKTSVKRNRKNP
jgi:hypothetical protein